MAHPNPTDDKWTDERWIVREPGSEVQLGPFSLDQVKQGLESGRFSNAAQLREQQSPEWYNAAKYIDLAASEAGLRPASHHAPSPRSTRIAAVSAGVLALAAVAAVVAVRWSAKQARSSPPAILATLTPKLPASTVSLREGPFRDELDQAQTTPSEYVAAWLAHRACGGPDLVQMLVGVRGKSLEDIERSGVLELPTNERWRNALQCGEQIRKSLLANSHVYTTFKDGDQLRSVVVLSASMTEFPSVLSMARHNFSGLDGACTHEPESKLPCAPGAAAVHDGTMWAFGDLEAVTSFAQAFTRGREELPTNVQILRDLSEHAGRAETTIVLARPDSIPWSLPCVQSAPSDQRDEYIQACYPPGQEHIHASVETKARGVSLQRDMTAASQTVGWTYLVWARDEEAAEHVRKDLLDLQRDWRAHLVNNEPQLIKAVRASNDPQAKYWDSVLEPLLRGIREATVQKEGRLVRLSMRQTLRLEEAKMLAEAAGDLREQMNASQQILGALLRRKALSQKALAYFVGQDVAAWMAAPRAQADDCAALRGKLQQVEVPVELLGLKADLEQRWQDDRCVGMVLPPDSQKCLLGATTLQALDACKLPPSPFVLDAKARLQGQWRVEAVKARPGQHLPWGFSARMSDCMLEFSQQKVAFRCLGETHVAPLDVQSSKVRQATVLIPMAKSVVPQQLELDSDGSLKMPSFDDTAAVTFHRVQRPGSLFDAVVKDSL